MNMSQEEFNSKIYDVIKDKAFISNGSGVLVEVVKKLPEQIEEGKVLFDGMMLFDGIEGNLPRDRGIRGTVQWCGPCPQQGRCHQDGRRA